MCEAFSHLLTNIDSQQIAITQAQSDLDTLKDQIKALSSNLNGLMASEEPWVWQFMYGAYKRVQSTILRNLHQQFQATNYVNGVLGIFPVSKAGSYLAGGGVKPLGFRVKPLGFRAP